MLIFLEGLDGSGKTTVAGHLKSAFLPEAVMLKLPSDALRSALSEGNMCDVSAANLFIADMCALIVEDVVPAVVDGLDVIVDRSWFSTLVYQSERLKPYGQVKNFMRGVFASIASAFGEGFARRDGCVDRSGFCPPFMVYLDVSPEESRRRLEARGGALEHFENVPLDVLQARAEAYRELMSSPDALGFEHVTVQVDGITAFEAAQKIFTACSEYCSDETGV